MRLFHIENAAPVDTTYARIGSPAEGDRSRHRRVALSPSRDCTNQICIGSGGRTERSGVELIGGAFREGINGPVLRSIGILRQLVVLNKGACYAIGLVSAAKRIGRRRRICTADSQPSVPGAPRIAQVLGIGRAESAFRLESTKKIIHLQTCRHPTEITSLIPPVFS